jgi:uncharacterized protein
VSCQLACLGARNESTPLENVFVLPILNRYLVYAPLADFAALVDRVAVQRIQEGLEGGIGTGQLDGIVHALRTTARPAPLPNQGSLVPPFLGLLPTRDCNLACEYCGFLAPGNGERVMSLDLARDAVAWYLDLVKQSGRRTAEVHFFGGEPFCAEEVVHLAVHAARLKAAEFGCTVRFEVVTNGTLVEDRCRWAADSLDSVLVSVDGPALIQDRYRHRKNGRGSFAAVARNARVLSEGATELSFRACVTAETVDCMPQTAAWLCEEFRPIAVCFEPVQPTPQSEAAGLTPPNPWAFARSFIRAAQILEAYGVEPVYAAADISTCQVSFCPVGRDVAIVSPDGTISGCYLLRQEWEAKGLDLDLGRFENGIALIDNQALEAVRSLNVWNKPSCALCFCKWHCAGGCHVNHLLPARPGAYTNLCIQTRIIALRNILTGMGYDGPCLASSLLEEEQALAQAIWQASDTLADVGAQL